MDPLVATLVLILLALLGARISFSTQRVPAGPRLLFRTGMHWLLLGWLLGPVGLALITPSALEDLSPLLAVGLGWVGLLFGIQLDRRSLRQFPLSHHVLAIGQAVVTLVFFVGVGWLALDLAGLRSPEATVILAGAAATACVSTPAGIAMISSNFFVRGDVRRLLFFVASIDAIVGIAALQLVYSIYHPAGVVAGVAVSAPALWLALGTGLGTVLAIAFLWLTRPRPAREELVLYLLGIAALGSGAALQFQLSPLFVTLVMGALIANFHGDPQRVYLALQKWEKPIYVILLLLAGALLTVTTWWVLPLGAAYAVVRGTGKVLGTGALVTVTPLPFEAPRRLGLGLLPQGGISLAMAVSLLLTYSGVRVGPEELPGTAILFDLVIVGIVLSELVGPWFTTVVLRRAGEISPKVEEALARGDEEAASAAAIRHSNPPTPPEGAPPP